MLRKISFNQIEEKSLENSYFTDIYDFDRLVRVKEYKDRAVRYMEKQDKQKRRKQREPVNIGEKVLLTAERLKKKDMPGILYKSSTQIIFNRNEIFNRRVGINNGETNYC